MRRVGVALASGLRAPVARWRLVLVLWLARLLPIVFVFGWAAYDFAAARSAHHPDAGRLLGPEGDGGFTYAWTTDLFRGDFAHAPDLVYGLVLGCWALVTLLSGGITARLVYRQGSVFLAECGYFAGRFLRLAFLVAALFYVADAGLNAVLAESQADRARLHDTQDFAVRGAFARGLLFLALIHLLGALHSYARIDIVTRDRRSVVLALLRACGRLFARLPSLLAVELGMALATGAAALVAWVLLRGAAPPGPGVGWGGVILFLFLAAAASYLRSGVELGTLEARCRILAEPSRNETVEPDPVKPDEEPSSG